MPKFRRMPGRVIEAVQWTQRPGEIFDRAKYPMVQFDHSTGSCFIETMHNGQRVNLEYGDWILPEPDGLHYYPCKPDVFSATYEMDLPEGDLGISFDPVFKHLNQGIELLQRVRAYINGNVVRDTTLMHLDEATNHVMAAGPELKSIIRRQAP